MPDYDFKQLSPYDFEHLSRDLLQAQEGLCVESFKTGRDNGIDFRFAGGSGKSIVQCKHYAMTGFVGLLRDLKKEIRNVEALSPDRYILITSVPLSPANKEKIRALFDKIIVTSDILGRDDLNNLLGLHPAIEKAHYKLWLTSRAVLDRVLHNAAATQSEFEVEKVYEQVRRYVSNAAYPRALDILNRDHVVIVSGQPGVGKTTLAKMLLYQHLEQGFEAVSILSDFQAGRDLYQSGKKQIFYFDDFLGSTFLGEKGASFTHNEDRAITEFLEMIRRSPTARLILTTREHILRQAIDASEKIRHSSIIDHRCVLEIGDYTFKQRAAILYNHLYFSDLPQEYKQALLDDDYYLEIVRHEKFNPRLIEWLSTYRRVRNVAPNDFCGFVRDLLRDPSEIWRHAYEKQISDASRSLLLALYSLYAPWGKVPAWALRQAFPRLHRHRAKKYGFSTKPEDMRDALGELNGSFIKPDGQMIDVINPSVLDMLETTLRRSPENALDVIFGAGRFEQLGRIWAFAKTKGNDVVRQALIDEAGQITEAIARLLNAPRKIQMGPVTQGYTDTSLERRLATLIDIVNVTRSEALRRLVVPFAETLLTDWWKAERVQFDDAIAIVAAIRVTDWATAESGQALETRLLRGMFKDAVRSCGSDELRKLAGLVSDDEESYDHLEMLQDAFESFARRSFANELSRCKTPDDTDGLIDDLEIIALNLGIDASVQIAATRKKADELLEEEDATEDKIQDKWIEPQLDPRSDETFVRDMFGSLRRDGD